MLERFLKIAIASTCLLGNSANAELSQIVGPEAQLIQFSGPAQYCVPRSLWRGGLTKATLDYQLVIPQADHFKIGDVFVGVARKSMPGKLWLSYGGSFAPYEDGKDPPAYMGFTSPGAQLQPVVPISVLFTPTDLTGLAGDAEIWVGYGLRSSANSTTKDSYQDMLSNRRFAKIWTVDPYAPPVALSTICFTATSMTLGPDAATLMTTPR